MSKLWLVFIVSLLQWNGIFGDPGLLGVSRGGGGDPDLSGATFKLVSKPPNSALSRLTGEGLYLALNQFAMEVSRGVLNATVNGFEFRRGKTLWLTTQLENSLEYRRNNDVVLSISASDRQPRPQLLFPGLGSLFDVLLDKGEGAKSLINMCIAERALASSLSSSNANTRDDASYCRDSTATNHLTVTQQIEQISRLLISLSEQSGRLASKTSSQEKNVETAVSTKLQPLTQRIHEVESKVSNTIERQVSTATAQIESMKKSWQNELSLIQQGWNEKNNKLQAAINETQSLEREALFQQVNETKTEIRLSMYTLANDVSSSIAKSNALFAKMLVETNQTLFGKIELQSSLFREIVHDTKTELQNLMTARDSIFSTEVSRNISQSITALHELLSQQISEKEAKTSRSFADLFTQAKNDRDRVDHSLSALNESISASLTSINNAASHRMNDFAVSLEDFKQSHVLLEARATSENAAREKENLKLTMDTDKRFSAVAERMEGLSLIQKDMEKNLSLTLRTELEKESEKIRRTNDVLQSRLSYTEKDILSLQEDSRLLGNSVQNISVAIGGISISLAERERDAQNLLFQLEESRKKIPEVMTELGELRVQTTSAVDGVQRAFDDIRNLSTEFALHRLSTSILAQDLAKERDSWRENIEVLRSEYTREIDRLKLNLEEEKTRAAQRETALSKDIADADVSLRVLMERDKDQTAEIQKLSKEIVDIRSSQQKDFQNFQSVLNSLKERIDTAEKENIQIQAKLDREKELKDQRIDLLMDKISEQKLALQALAQENEKLRMNFVQKDSFEELRQSVRDIQSTILNQAMSLFQLVTNKVSHYSS